MFKKLAFAIAAVSIAIPATAVQVAVGSGEITAQDPLSNGRIFRDGVASTWAAPKAFPGSFGGSLHYDAVSIDFVFNATQDVYYEIFYTNLDGFTPHLSAYLDSFNPADISINYLGDSGATPNAGVTASFQVIVPTGGSLVLWFGGVGSQFGRYDYVVNAYSDDRFGENFGVIPEPATWAMLIAGFGLVGASLRRRQRLATTAA